MHPALRYIEVVTCAIMSLGLLVHVGLVSLGLVPINLKNSNDAAHLRAAIHGHLEQTGSVPTSLAQIRTQSDRPALYDTTGHRLVYHRLDARTWLLRSFGRDLRETSLTSEPDPVLSASETPDTPDPSRETRVVWNPLATDRSPIPYPWIVLQGLLAPDHRSVARLYLDPTTGARTLTVTSIGDEPLRWMVAPHLAIEEIFWHPTSRYLIYVAAPSPTWNGGVYLWDLALNDHRNLWKDPPQREQPTLEWILQIVGSVAGGNRLLVRAASSDTATVRLFSVNTNSTPDTRPNLEELSIEADDPCLTASELEVALGAPSSSTTPWLNHQQYLQGASSDPLGTIEALQGLTQELDGSPGLGYVLRDIVCLYRHSLQVASMAREEQLRLLELGRQVASALELLPTAPRYLRLWARSAAGEFERFSHDSGTETP